MKKLLLPIALFTLVLVQSCGKPAETTKLDKYDLTFTSPKLDATPEYIDMKTSDTDTELSQYDFNMGGHARVTITEIAASVYPTDVEMLKAAIEKSEDFVELIETKKLSNGAFGVIYKIKASSGNGTVKDYTFYFKKKNRYFKLKPVFNNELKDLDKQVAAYESLK